MVDSVFTINSTAMTGRLNRTSLSIAKLFLNLLPLLIILSSCTTSQSYLLNEVQTIPLFPLEPAPKRILVLNTFDVSEKNYRQNKEDLFNRLLDSAMVDMSYEIHHGQEIPTEVLHGLTRLEDADNSINTLIKKHEASHAINITDFDVHFYQTEVEVTGEEKDSKTKVAYYDIIANINYILYNEEGVLSEFPVIQSRFHSTRKVLSGLLAAGPNVVENSDDALSLVRENTIEYLKYFFPLWVRRTRKVFDTKELSSVREAISKEDYEAAFEISHRYAHNPDRKLAAKANYNCAILMERKHRPHEAQLYLQESLRLYNLQEASSIKSDFGLE